MPFSVVLISVLLAAKFYMETDEVVFNSDIANILQLHRHHPMGVCQCLTLKDGVSNLGKVDDSWRVNSLLVNRMEHKMCEVLDFNFHVSLAQYNQV